MWAMTKARTIHIGFTRSGSTADDAFFKPNIDLEDKGIENLSASQLIKPDSFPSGGLRATHAARSYSIWDPSSPVFILETIYIPAVFVSYTGESWITASGPTML